MKSRQHSENGTSSEVMLGKLKRSMTVLFRVVAIVFVAVLIIVVASSNTPVPQTASAKIFDDVIWHVKNLPDYFGQHYPSGAPVEVSINGSRMFYATSQSSHATRDILDYYENLYHVDRDVFLSAPDLPEGDALLAYQEKLGKLVDQGKLSNTLRLETRRWGVFGVLDNLPDGGWEGSIQDNFSDFIERGRTMLETGDVSELGDPKVVLVFRNSPTSDATIFRTWLDGDFDFNSFVPGSDGDWPGDDIDDVPRYPGSKRIISFSLPEMAPGSALNVYRSDERILGTALYYRTELRKQGWKLTQPVDQVMKKKGDRYSMHFTRKNKECWISLKDKGDFVYHSILYRTRS